MRLSANRGITEFYEYCDEALSWRGRPARCGVGILPTPGVSTFPGRRRAETCCGGWPQRVLSSAKQQGRIYRQAPLCRELVEGGAFAPGGGNGRSLAVDENDFAGLGDGFAVQFEAAVVHQVGDDGLGGVGGIGFTIR